MATCTLKNLVEALDQILDLESVEVTVTTEADGTIQLDLGDRGAADSPKQDPRGWGGAIQLGGVYPEAPWLRRGRD
jgi:hypothetical protein